MTEGNYPLRAHSVLIHTDKELVLLHGMTRSCYTATGFTTVQIRSSGLPCQISVPSTSSAIISATAGASLREGSVPRLDF